MYCYHVLILIVYIFENVFACYLDDTTCDERVFGHDSFVCVCDEEYCDIIGDVKLPKDGLVKIITSSRDKHRFAITERKMDDDPNPESHYTVEIDYNKEFQTMIGFGGAFTDSAGMAVKSLSEGGQIKLLRSYFGSEGIEYNLCRVPIGGTDFSTRPYSYDDIEGDKELKHFELTSEDMEYKIPLIQISQKLSEKKFLLFGTTWSPPAWMKDNGKFNGSGSLLKEMWDPYSNYLVKFIREYENHDINIWGLTTVNEPFAGLVDNKEWQWNQCIFTAVDARDWIKQSFGPILEKENLRRIKFILFEGERTYLMDYVKKVLDDPKVSKYIDGISVHWYLDNNCSSEILDKVQKMFEDKFILYTEACEGFLADSQNRVQLGSWERAESYASSIIETVNHYSTGWVDWNLALDMQGGPNWSNNFVDAPIIVNEEMNEFYKQPMFYAMGHFSKFINEGSKRLNVSINARIHNSEDNFKMSAFRNTDNSYTFVMLNKDENNIKVTIQYKNRKYLNINVQKKSVNTIIFR